MSAQRPRVLVVDDDDMVRNLVVRIVQEYFQDVEEATDGDQAIEQLQTGRYSLVISDLRMGAEPNYVFSFVVGQTSPEKVGVAARQLEKNRDLAQLKKAWRRIWSADSS